MNAGDIVEGAKGKGVLSAGFAIVGIGAIHPANLLANRYGKRTTLFVVPGMNPLGGGAPSLLSNPGNPWKILVAPRLCGPAWTAADGFQYSMPAGVCDDDELRRGLRREGMRGSFFSWIRKTGFALAFFGAGVALHFDGSDAGLGGAPAHGTIIRMRLMLAGSIALWALLASGRLCPCLISKTCADETRDLLEARRGSTASA